MAATVAKSQAPTTLPSSRGLASPAVSASHAAHEHRHHHQHGHYQPQDVSANSINGRRVELLPRTQKLNPNNFKVVRTLGT
ncbi:hypothetical protein E4U53_000629, partial [Claviceps sorghi]